MNLYCLRPPVADLIFQVYARPLHPELFDILAVRYIEHQDYLLSVRITRSGHIISWRHGDRFVTEVADVRPPLSDSRRLLVHRLRGEHAGTVRLGGGFVYQMNFQVETLAPEIFLHVQDEILADGCKRGLLHNFQPNHRLAVAPVGHVVAEARSDCLFLSCCHTFPDENTIVKTQSLIERRPNQA